MQKSLIRQPRWSNRPFNSLVEIFTGWINNSSASHSDRLSVLERVIVPKHPNVAWKLMVALLLNNHSTSSGISKPSYRNWACGIKQSTLEQDYAAYVNSLVNLLIGLIDKGGAERVCDLIENFGSFDAHQTKRIIDILLSYPEGDLEAEQKDLILNKLRHTLDHHRGFPSSNWSYSESLLGQLEAIYHHFDHHDFLKANLFLFNDHWPKLVTPIEREEASENKRDKKILALRVSAIETIYDENKEAGVVQLISECSEPSVAAEALYASRIANYFEKMAIEWLEKNDFRYSFADRFISCMSHGNYQRAIKLLDTGKPSWSVLRQARFVLSFRVSSETLGLIKLLPIKAQDIYWSELRSWRVVHGDYQLIQTLASNFLEHKRPCSALKTMGQLLYSHKDKSEIDSTLLASILTQIITDSSEKDSITIQDVYQEILTAIKFLQDSDVLEPGQIQSLEWGFLGMSGTDYRPRYLSKHVTENPDFFVQLVSWAFKRKDGQSETHEGKSKEQAQNLAQKAYRLLKSVDVIPGEKGGSMDESVLQQWVDTVREKLANVSRSRIGDDQIGALLSRCSVGEDGIWPHEAVRSISERLRSDSLDGAIECGKRNSRGTTSRHPYSGGNQERDLAKQYSEDAKTLQLIYPRTSEMLRSISDSYTREADRWDQDVEAGR